MAGNKKSISSLIDQLVLAGDKLEDLKKIAEEGIDIKAELDTDDFDKKKKALEKKTGQKLVQKVELEYEDPSEEAAKKAVDKANRIFEKELGKRGKRTGTSAADYYAESIEDAQEKLINASNNFTKKSAGNKVALQNWGNAFKALKGDISKLPSEVQDNLNKVNDTLGISVDRFEEFYKAVDTLILVGKADHGDLLKGFKSEVMSAKDSLNALWEELKENGDYSKLLKTKEVREEIDKIKKSILEISNNHNLIDRKATQEGFLIELTRKYKALAFLLSDDKKEVDENVSLAFNKIARKTYTEQLSEKQKKKYSEKGMFNPDLLKKDIDIEEYSIVERIYKKAFEASQKLEVTQNDVKETSLKQLSINEDINGEHEKELKHLNELKKAYNSFLRIQDKMIKGKGKHEGDADYFPMRHYAENLINNGGDLDEAALTYELYASTKPDYKPLNGDVKSSEMLLARAKQIHEEWEEIGVTVEKSPLANQKIFNAEERMLRDSVDVRQELINSAKADEDITEKKRENLVLENKTEEELVELYKQEHAALKKCTDEEKAFHEEQKRRIADALSGSENYEHIVGENRDYFRKKSLKNEATTTEEPTFEDDLQERNNTTFNTAPVDAFQKKLAETSDQVHELHKRLDECFGEGFTTTLAKTNFAELEKIDALIEQRGLSVEEAFNKVREQYDNIEQSPTTTPLSSIPEQAEVAKKSIEEVREELMKLLNSDVQDSKQISDLLGLNIDDVNDKMLDFAFGGATNEQMADVFMLMYKRANASYNTPTTSQSSEREVESNDAVTESVKREIKSYEDLVSIITEMQDIYSKMEKNKYKLQDYDINNLRVRDAISRFEGIGISEPDNLNVENIPSILKTIYKEYKKIESAIKNNRGYYKGISFDEDDLLDFQGYIKSLFSLYAQLGGKVEQITDGMTKPFKQMAIDAQKNALAVDAANEQYNKEEERLEQVNEKLQDQFDVLNKIIRVAGEKKDLSLWEQIELESEIESVEGRIEDADIKLIANLLGIEIPKAAEQAEESIDNVAKRTLNLKKGNKTFLPFDENGVLSGGEQAEQFRKISEDTVEILSHEGKTEAEIVSLIRDEIKAAEELNEVTKEHLILLDKEGKVISDHLGSTNNVNGTFTEEQLARANGGKIKHVHPGKASFFGGKDLSHILQDKAFENIKQVELLWGDSTLSIDKSTLTKQSQSTLLNIMKNVRSALTETYSDNVGGTPSQEAREHINAIEKEIFKSIADKLNVSVTESGQQAQEVTTALSDVDKAIIQRFKNIESSMVQDINPAEIISNKTNNSSDNTAQVEAQAEALEHKAKEQEHVNKAESEEPNRANTQPTQEPTQIDTSKTINELEELGDVYSSTANIIVLSNNTILDEMEELGSIHIPEPSFDDFLDGLDTLSNKTEEKVEEVFQPISIKNIHKEIGRSKKALKDAMNFGAIKIEDNQLLVNPAKLEEFKKQLNSAKEEEEKLSEANRETSETAAKETEEIKNVGDQAEKTAKKKNKATEANKELSKANEDTAESAAKESKGLDSVSADLEKLKALINAQLASEGIGAKIIDQSGLKYTLDSATGEIVGSFDYTIQLLNEQTQRVHAVWDETANDWVLSFEPIRTNFKQLEKDIISSNARLTKLQTEYGVASTTSGTSQQTLVSLEERIQAEQEINDRLNARLEYYARQDTYEYDAVSLATFRAQETEKTNQENLAGIQSINKAEDKRHERIARNNQLLNDQLSKLDEMVRSSQSGTNRIADPSTLQQIETYANSIRNQITNLFNSDFTVEQINQIKNGVRDLGLVINQTFEDNDAEASNFIEQYKRAITEYKDIQQRLVSGTSLEGDNIRAEQLRNLLDVIRDMANIRGLNGNDSFVYALDRMDESIDRLNTKGLVSTLNSLSKSFSTLDVNGDKFLSKTDTELKRVKEEIAQILDLVNKGNFDLSNPDDVKRFQSLTKSVKNLKVEMAKDENKAGKELSVDKIIRNASKTVNDNTAMTRDIKKEYDDLINRAKAFQNIMENGGEISKKQVDELALSLTRVDAKLQASGKTGKSFFTRIKDAATSSSAQLFNMFFSLYDWARYFRQIASSIVELDDALVDLKKTTKMTNSELNDFYYTSNEIAIKMGVTTSEIINQASAFSRLGYNTKEASESMAELSSQFASISPDMDVSTATDGLVSVMKAFQVDVNDVERDILDNINIIGNTAATSNGEIVDMLQRSSAAMKEANNTLEETIALESAAVEITRSAETTGTTFKTVAMRIRGYDEETEELSEDLENISGDIADLTKTVETPGGISLFTDANKTEYKSTYQLFKEISEIYDKLTDKQQANLLEKLAGKRGGQVVGALLTNFDSAEEAMRNMEQAAGSADREMEIIKESLSYKINALKETWVGTFQEILSRDDVGDVIDGATEASEGLGKAIEGLIPIVKTGVDLIVLVTNAIAALTSTFGGLTPYIVGGAILSGKNIGAQTSQLWEIQNCFDKPMVA